MSDGTPPEPASGSEPELTNPGWAAPTPPPTAPWPTPAPASTAPPSPSWDVAPGATPDPGSSSAPPAAPKRKLTWLWVLIGALTLVAVLVIAGDVLFVRSIAGPIDATNRVLQHVKGGEYAAAQRASCAYDRALDPVEYARAFEDTIDDRGKITGYDVNYSSVGGSHAVVRYDVEWARKKPSRLEAIARKEGGKWRTCLLKVR